MRRAADRQATQRNGHGLIFTRNAESTFQHRVTLFAVQSGLLFLGRATGAFAATRWVTAVSGANSRKMAHVVYQRQDSESFGFAQ